MLFDGVFGTAWWCSRGLRDAAAGDAWPSVDPVAGRTALLGTDFGAASTLTLERGGGNGDIDTEVTEAE